MTFLRSGCSDLTHLTQIQPMPVKKRLNRYIATVRNLFELYKSSEIQQLDYTTGDKNVRDINCCTVSGNHDILRVREATQWSVNGCGVRLPETLLIAFFISFSYF